MSTTDHPTSERMAQDRDTITVRETRDGRPVWVRSPRSADPRPDPDVAARLRYGASVAGGIDLPGVVRVLGVEEGDGGPRVVLEDFGGHTLRSALDAEGRLEITEGVRVATQVARTLAGLHARRVVHKCVAPTTIVINTETGDVKLTGFDCASLLDREEAALAGRGHGGPPAYVAPEQTGRMNRAVDDRADLYALGATLYEMITGRVPFPDDDPATRAQPPAPPDRLRPTVPAALSDVVQKLLATHAEDRYQSAEGLISDLNECLGHLIEGATLADFQIGRNDVTQTFRLPQQIYGRAAEREALLAAFTRATRGAAELVVVTGPPGAGKTALVNELRAPAHRDHAYFCAGSGDPVRALPYGAFRRAFEDLVLAVLAEGDDQALTLGGQLLDAVGPGLPLVVEVIPALARLVPEACLAELEATALAVRDLGPAEARDRFDLAFQRTIGVFAGPKRPLVLFLDDLSWVDPASLRMVEILLRDPGARHLMVVVAVSLADAPRSTAGAGALAAATLAAVMAGPTAASEIALPPLRPADVDRLLAEALGCPGEEPPRPLAALVRETTEGNPLAIHQVLGWLHGAGLLRLDPASGRWEHAWSDGGSARALAAMPPAVEGSADRREAESFLSGGLGGSPPIVDDGERSPERSAPRALGVLFDARLAGLPAASSRALSIAACFGRRFDLETVARAAGQTRRSAAADLWPAVEAGLIHPLGGAHRSAAADPTGDLEHAFVHPRAHAAALARISPELRREIREQAAIRRLAEATEDERRASLFDLADQLLSPPSARLAAEERISRARLALDAGERARRCNAHAAAARFLGAGLSLLADDDDPRAAALRFALHRDHAECAYLEGRVAEAEAEIDLLRGLSRDEGERTAADRLHLQLAHGLGDFAGAVRVGCAALERLGIHLPEREGAAAALAAEIEGLGRALAARALSAASVVDLPATDDPDERARVELLALTLLAAAQGDPDRFRLAGAMMVGRSLRHGPAPFSSLGFGAYGVVAAAHPGALPDLSSAALPLADRFDGPGTRAAVQSFGAIFTSPLRRPLRESLAPLEEAHAGALAAGDLRLAGLAAVQRLLLGLMSGEDLYRLQDRAGAYLALLRRLGRAVSAALTTSIQRTLTLLTRGLSDAPPSPLGEAGSARGGGLRRPTPVEGPPSGPWSATPAALAASEEDLRKVGASDARAFASHWVLALERAFLFGDHARALAHAAQAGARFTSVRGHPIEAEYRLYHALTLAAAGTPEAQAAELPAVHAHRDRLAAMAEESPGNFSHRHLLVAAEAARVEGDAAALDLYDRAIDAAAEHQHPGHEALAAEIAARFHLAAGRRHVARAYLLHAGQAYARWGADAKVRDLRRHADLLRDGGQPSQRAAQPLPTIGPRERGGSPADLEAVLKASRRISAERSTDALHRLLLTQAVQHGGAQRGLLLLHADGRTGDAEAVISAERGGDGDVTVDLREGPIDAQEDLARSVVRHAEETREVVALDHASADGQFRSDPYVIHARPRSLVCLPLLSGDEVLGAIYLEDNVHAGAFTADRRAALSILAAQGGVALANARAHGALRRRVEAQADELARSHADLGEALARVKDAQKRLLVQEKLASLGGLLAGVAHEIKNPLNFINNFAESSVGLAEELAEDLHAQRARMDPGAAQNLEELLGEIKGNAGKIHEHGRRAEEIVRSMLEHSRTAGTAPRPVDLNALLREHVVLAYQGFRAQDPAFNAAIEHGYEKGLAPITVVPQDLGRVFLNLVNNACYAVYAKRRALGRAFAPAIKVSTRDLGDAVEIRIRDNGSGIPAAVKERIYDAFFTTKPAGEGTGLGLSISNDIVRARGGTLAVESEDGQFTEFVITLPRKAP